MDSLQFKKMFMFLCLFVLFTTFLLVYKNTEQSIGVFLYKSSLCQKQLNRNKWFISVNNARIEDDVKDWILYNSDKDNSQESILESESETFTLLTSSWLQKKLLDIRTKGFLTAIANGAKYIYTSDKNFQNSTISGLAMGSHTTGLLYNRGRYFNPDKHFWNINQPPSWLSVGLTDSSALQYSMVESFSPIIQISILTNSSTYRPPPVLLPKGVLSEFEPMNILFLYKSFWSLMIPMTSENQSCHLWYNLWCQRLMWEIDEQIGYYELPINHKPTKNNDQVYTAHDWIQILKTWSCPKENSFYQCAILLSDLISKKLLCNQFMTEILEDWFSDLTAVGYPEPIRSDVEISNVIHLANITYSPYLNINKYTNFAEQLVDILSICTDIQVTKTTFSKKNIQKHIHENILLLIVFNFPLYHIIPKLEMTYRPFFPNLAYCGTNKEQFFIESQKFKYNVTFIEIDDDKGLYNYICMSVAIKMRYRIDGYLLIGDDTLLNVPALVSLPWNKFWYGESMAIRRSSTFEQWGNWQLPFGREAIHASWKELLYLATLSPLVSDRLSTLNHNVFNNTRFSDGILIAGADIYYVPSRFQTEFTFFTDIFYKHRVILELAVGTSMISITTSNNLQILKGHYLWSETDRADYQHFYAPDKVYIHPIKFGTEFKKENGLKFFCEKFYPNLLFPHH